MYHCRNHKNTLCFRGGAWWRVWCLRRVWRGNSRYRSASELLLRLGHLNIDPGSDNIVNESNRQGSTSSHSSAAKTSFQAAARRRSAIAMWRKRRRSPKRGGGQVDNNTNHENDADADADEANRLVGIERSEYVAPTCQKCCLLNFASLFFVKDQNSQSVACSVG